MMESLAFMNEFLNEIQELPIGLYGVLLVSYLFLQIYYAIREKQRQKTFKNRELISYPFVSILVPFYNETIEEMNETIESLISLSYDNYEILVMDDGSQNPETYNNILDKYKTKTKVKIFKQENGGKRAAQVALTNLCHPDAKYYLAVDSDSVLDPQCLKELVKTAELFNVDAVSGGILVKYKKQVLNRLLKIRYWISNWQERLSQSWFNQVNCCSGPCTLWKRSIFDLVREKYVNQKFLGKKCTYGDDRHMTNLFIMEGGKIKMADRAYCHTSTPETWGKWVKQQTRWSKSFYRESYWSFKHLQGKMGWFFRYQNTMAFLLPFVLLANVFIYMLILTPTSAGFLFYLLAIFAAGFIRGIYAFACTRDLTYFLAPIYGVIHFIIVFPIRVMALFQLRDTKWGTR